MTTDYSRAAGGPGDMNDEVARLVRLAGTSGPIAPLDEARLARVRTAVYGAWSDEYIARQSRQVKTRRRRLTVAVLFAAAASVVIAIAIWGPIRTLAPVRVAHIDRFTEQATGSPGPFTAGGAVMSGSTVTTSVGTLAMTLTSGVHLRLDASSTARLDSATDVVLERGAVYVDSAGAPPTQPSGSPIIIYTPGGGLVRDIGTQFEVRLDGAGLRIRVRDGEVLVTDANGVDTRAGAGQELFSWLDGSDRSISRRPIAATGSEWAWAERAAPAFSMKGKTLGEFLDWVSREGAWTVTFADSGLSAARATVIQGKPDLLRGLTLAEALNVVLPTCGLRHHIDINGHRLVIERETSK
ncbi:MAG TPA: FecR domain-containing protein [Vicinamibacterales bacterium]|nr:FecR domain-containing protein [Vicinamibacterales bacterium]